MTTVLTTEPVPFDLPREAPQQVCENLNQWLTDLIGLSLRLKQAHWNLRGPRFKSVHEQLDEILADVRKASDDVAERIVTIGGAADGRPRQVAEHSSLGSFPPGQLGVDQAVEQCCSDLAATIRRGRACQAALAGLDAVSEGLAIDVLAALEKHHWLLRSQADRT
ncbi:MAG: DNA starvation/stationary phase protection protein [Planctomycetes bacterium]|nr:DNA starvation/stationary phase protection protein [Planctomycetota bacterium]